MAGAAPFFVTPATLGTLSTTTAAATASATSTSKSSSGSKRKASVVEGSLLRSSIEDLVASTRDTVVPLSDIRDVLLDHVMETLETDLKYTVFLVCEDVTDLHPVQAASTADQNGATVEDAATSSASTDAPPASASGDAKKTAADAPAALAYLDNTDDWYRFQSQLSEGDSIPRCDATLLRMPVSKRDLEKEKKAAKKALKMKIKKHKKLTGENGKPTAEFYVLTPQELKVHVSSIPYNDSTRAAAFLTTQPLADANDAAPLLLALDCEMCKTTKGVELARLTLVDANEQVVIDEYVRPTHPITDYCTQYSGITPEIMASTSNTLSDIQALFLKHVPAQAILIGHSIENDLQALQVMHHRVIDTTALYPHPKGPPFRSALRFLASTYLSRAIQTGSDGHCSIEDAIATLQLAQLKIKHGPTFPSIEQDYKQKKVVNELCRLKKSVLLVDTQRACRSLSGGAACIIPCDANDKIAHTVVHQLTTGFPPTFTWARLRGATRAEVAVHAHEIKTHLPANACLVVVLGGDSSELRELHKLRTTRADPRCSLLWDKAMQAKLDAAAAHVQRGVVHVYLSGGT